MTIRCHITVVLGIQGELSLGVLINFKMQQRRFFLARLP